MACPCKREERGLEWQDHGRVALRWVGKGGGEKGEGFFGGSVVKNSPAVQETWVRSLGREDPLEKELATHSSILAWESLWTEEPGGLQSMGLQRVGHKLSD